MSSLVQVSIHRSQFPERVTQDLLESLRLRQVNHKFHYDSVKQAQRWLAVHQAYSPSRTESDCATAYDRGFKAVTARIPNRAVHVIGLGCGGGQKEARLLELLRDSGKEMLYTPSDVSVALVLGAVQTAQSVIAPSHCFPLVCDLASADDLSDIIGRPYQQAGSGLDLKLTGSGGEISPQVPARLLTFFGMIPNFEPDAIFPKLKSLLRPADYLLLSANLAPGPDYAAGVNRILPQYDNDLTREWLLTFLLDLGVERGDGELRFVIETHPEAKGLKRITVYFDFTRNCCLQVGAEKFEFEPKDSIRQFFSYRHTPAVMDTLLAGYGLRVLEQWVSSSQEEGVFLIKR